MVDAAHPTRLRGRVAGAIAALGLGLSSLAAAPAFADMSQERTISGTVSAEHPKLEADRYEVTASWADDAVIPGEPPPPESVTVLTDPDSGDYVVDGLEPGIYFVEFEPVTSDGDADPALEAEYYDDAQNLMDAVPVDVSSGPAMGIDAELATQKVFSDVSDDGDSSSYSEFYDEITWLAHEDITRGWSNGRGAAQFRPFAHITRDAMAAFLYRYAGSPDVELPDESPFSDVSPESSEFYKEIVWLEAQGIADGWEVGDTLEFRPFEKVTRDAMAAFLFRFAGSPDGDAPFATEFVDVEFGQPFYRETEWLAATEISSGWTVDGSHEFRPYSPSTRDAMAAFLYRLDTVVSGS